MTAGSVLVVDDDALNRILLTELLEVDGYRATTATDGAQALNALDAQPFDAVLLDVVMPGVDGIRVLETIKSDPDLCDVPVLMISSLEKTEAIVHCLKSGAEDFVSKPFDPQVLRAKINGCVARGRRRIPGSGDGARERVAGSITALHTLGPKGTNCELAARSWFERRGTGGTVVLHPTFEEAADHVVITPGAALLGCVAYPDLHTLVYSHVDELVLVDCLIIPTYGMVLARRPGSPVITSVASHPAPASLAPEGTVVRLSTSNSQAARDCAAGLVDACITTGTAMEQHRLELVRDFGSLSMGFTIHARSAAGEGGRHGNPGPRLDADLSR